MLGNIRQTVVKSLPASRSASRRRNHRVSSNTLSLSSSDCCRRTFSTSRLSSQDVLKSTPLFGSSSSAWDSVFEGVQDMPPMLPQARSIKRMPRKQTMTAREISAFDDMFSMIFNAVAEQKGPQQPGDVAVGGRGRTEDIFGTLRKHSKRVKWTKDADEDLDRKKEQMSVCDTDHELLEWAMREVFEESTRLEEKSRAALAKAQSGEEVVEQVPMLQSPTYPHLVALLMSSFRDRYSDPHLALSIFNHAKHLSVPSYVFGCTTMAYNELIETRWTCFRDLKGVYDALIEMTVNGVDIDTRTRKLVENLRSEIGARTVWVEEDAMSSGEVWEMLSKIEELVRDKTRKGTEGPTRWDDWKSMELTDEAEDPWGFDKWEQPTSSSFAGKSRQPIDLARSAPRPARQFGLTD